jgi:soluble lytic murein transglycosylase
MKRTHLIPLVAALLAAGCNLNQPPQIVLETPEVTESATATEAPPTQTPTATIPPTPTIPPEIILSRGDRYLLNGEFESAAATYKALVNQAGSDPDASAEAAYGMGQAAVREGLFEDAVESLTTFIDDYPQDERVAQAHYLRGDAHLGLSRWDEAIADFEAYLALRPGLIDSYTYERIGDAQVALSQTDVALTSYVKAADASRETNALLALRERVAQINASAGRTADAVAQYDAILEVAQNPTYHASIALLAAQTLMDSGDVQGGLVRMNQIFTNTPEQPQSYEAMTVLLANNVNLDDFERGKVSYNYGDYQAALAAFNNFTEAHTNAGDISAELYLMLGRSYREIGSAQAALTSFQTIIDYYATDPLFGTALLEQGQTSAQAGDNATAIEQYMHIADTYNYLPEAPEALWRAGYLYSLDGQTEQARAVFERLADNYPDSPQTSDGLFLAASLAYQAGEPDSAERYYAEISVKSSGEEAATAYFWVGRLALQRGDNRVANQAFAQVLQNAPDSYFAARSADIIDGEAPFAPPESLQFEFDEDADRSAAEDWIRTTFDITQEGALWQLAPELADDERLLRGREFWGVAEYEEALAEFDDLIAANQTNALACYQLAVYFRELGAYYSSVVAASYVIRNAQVGTLDAPLYIARMRYPVYYLDLVQQASERRSIDPLLIFALIRHESLFNTYANGSAVEKGLMQVVPGTAEYIAAELRWSNYQHADLYRPYAGIEFGSYYLEQQLRRFGENVPAALAAYNAGPGRAEVWLELSGDDPDQFMTAIDVDSTRSYVESIYSYYNIYRVLYGGADEA